MEEVLHASITQVRKSTVVWLTDKQVAALLTYELLKKMVTCFLYEKLPDRRQIIL